jgi:hypothetical protein
MSAILCGNDAAMKKLLAEAAASSFFMNRRNGTPLPVSRPPGVSLSAVSVLG